MASFANLERIACGFKMAGLPLDALDTSFLTEDECCAFYKACRVHGVKHSDEINAAPIEPMDSAALARANID